MDDPAYAYPMRYFETLIDPRARNIRHRLMDVLTLALLATVGGATGWQGMADFAWAKRDWLAGFMDVKKHGLPSNDTFARVIGRLDPGAMEQCFMQWMRAVVAQSAGCLRPVDGKSLRRSFERGWDKSGMAHMVSMFATENGLALGQVQCAGKGGELEAIRQLLGMVDLSGTVVSIDAIGCQKDIAEQIIAAGGDWGGRFEPGTMSNGERPTRHATDLLNPQAQPINSGTGKPNRSRDQWIY